MITGVPTYLDFQVLNAWFRWGRWVSLRPQRRSGLLALPVLLSCVACGSSHTASSRIPVLRTGDSYDQSKVAECLRRTHLNASAGRSEDLLPPLPRVPGLTGAINVLPSGPDVGPVYGAPFEGVLLLFERTSSSAVRNVDAVVTALKQSVILIGRQKPLQPPASLAKQYESVNGNLIVLWDYPPVYRERSHIIVARCLAAGRSPDSGARRLPHHRD